MHELVGSAHPTFYIPGCVVTDHSRFASDEVRRLLVANGISNLASAFQVGESLDDEHARRATRHAERRVVRLDLGDTNGTTTVYIKRQWKRERWLPRPTDIRHRIGVQCSP